jgi:hypothetical protein
MRLFGFGLSVAALALLGSGCIFSPKTDDKPPPPVPKTYLEPISPENVLENLKTAYEARDSVEYKNIYAASYEGTSTDLSDPQPTVSTFRYADETAHMGKLAQVTTIVSVVFDIGLRSTWHPIASDDPAHPEWMMVQINASKIQIYDGPTLYSAVSTNAITFTFEPTSVNGLTTWKIVRWNEQASSA